MKHTLSKPHPGRRAAASHSRLPRKPADRLEGRLGITSRRRLPRRSAGSRTAPRFWKIAKPSAQLLVSLLLQLSPSSLQLLFIVAPRRCKCQRSRWVEGTSHRADTVFMQSQANRARKHTGRARRPSESETRRGSSLNHPSGARIFGVFGEPSVPIIPCLCWAQHAAALI